jgi:hypothetical protein
VAMENAIRRWRSPTVVAVTAASVARKDLPFAIGNTIVIDVGTVTISCSLLQRKT